MANTVAKENPEYGWQLLQKALQVCLNYKSNTSYYPDIYFMPGRFATENCVHLQEGLSYFGQ